MVSTGGSVAPLQWPLETRLAPTVSSRPSDAAPYQKRIFDGKIHSVDRRRGAAADHQPRHRQDLPGGLSEDDQADRALAMAFPGDPFSPGRVGEPGFSP